jgi:glycosyltransferase involved in cell wall biosynthesis
VSASSDTVIVVPCFDEAARLRPAVFEDFAGAHPHQRFVFVDDGSTDTTRAILAGLEAREPDRFRLLALPTHRGKAEAVRAGMLAAFEAGPAVAGYWDADLSTPLWEIPHLAAELEADPRLLAVLGARVMLLGRSIERRPLRHYAGRLVATLISETLGVPIYDTQCGAKLFRVTPVVRALFAEPFVTNWTFDVEVLARLVAAHRRGAAPDLREAVREVPLHQWHHVAGSKVRASDLLRALFEVRRIRARYLR